MAGLASLWRWLNRDLTGRTWAERAQHPFFGATTLWAFRDTSASYWEAQLIVDGRTVDVVIDAPNRTPPTDAQTAFAKALTSSADAAYRHVANELGQAFAAYYGEPIPTDRADWLMLIRFTVPADGELAREIGYESVYDGRHVQFDCVFDGDGRLAVRVEG